VNAWKPILAALVIFAAGVVTGGLTFQLRHPEPGRPAEAGGGRRRPMGMAQRPEARLKELMRRMETDLDLKPAQRERIGKMLEESQTRLKGIWEQIPSEFQALRKNIRAELDPEQRAKFEEIFKPREEYRKSHQNSHGDEHESEHER